jgi:hypothetical protein
MANYYIQQKEHIPYEKTVIEKRAPTDDSIRLFEEMKDKAYHSILESVCINQNTFTGKAILAKDWQSAQYIAMYKFVLNGTAYEGRIEVTESLIRSFETEIYRIIAKRMSEEISIALLKECITHSGRL